MGRIKLGFISIPHAVLNKLFVAGTTLCRMAVGFGVFVVLARSLGPASFGFVTGVFAYASIISLITDFGFGSKNLRDIAAHPADGRGILLDTLELKAMLTAGVLGICLPILLFLPFSSEDKIGAALLAAGVLATSFGGLGVVGLRAIGRFGAEAWITLWTSVIYAGATSVAVIFWPRSVIAIGCAFFASRCIYAAAGIFASLACFQPGVRPRRARLSTAVNTAISGAGWAADNALIVLGAQIDAVLIGHFGTLVQLGTYQAGARIVENVYSLAVVISTVQIPALSRLHSHEKKTFRVEGYKTLVEFTLVGGVLALFLVLLGPTFAKDYLGKAYGALVNLWPGFAALVLLRFLAGGLGVLLTVTGQINSRIAGQIVGIIAILISFRMFFPDEGLNSMPWIMCTGALATSVVYSFVWLFSRG